MAPAESAATAAPAILAEVKPAVLPRPLLVENNRSFAWITDKICGIIEGKTPALVVGVLRPRAASSPRSRSPG